MVMPPKGPNQVYYHSVVVRCQDGAPPAVEKAFSAIYDSIIAAFCAVSVKKYVFQLERGLEAKKLHYQCFVQLEVKKRPKELEKLLFAELEDHKSVKNVGAQLASQAGKNQLLKYCMKTDATKVAGPWASQQVYMGQGLLTTLRPWQEELKTSILADCTDDRKITWVYDPKGGAGKSAFAKYMAYHHSIPKFTFAAARDLLYLVSKFPNKPAYIFDLSRTKPASVSMSEIYQALEDIKNGHFISTKYECEMVLMQSPHVIVFANCLPEFEKLSADKWDVRKFGEPNEPGNIMIRINPMAATDSTALAPSLPTKKVDLSEGHPFLSYAPAGRTGKSWPAAASSAGRKRSAVSAALPDASVGHRPQQKRL